MPTLYYSMCTFSGGKGQGVTTQRTKVMTRAAEITAAAAPPATAVGSGILALGEINVSSQTLKSI